MTLRTCLPLALAAFALSACASDTTSRGDDSASNGTDSGDGGLSSGDDVGGGGLNGDNAGADDGSGDQPGAAPIHFLVLGDAGTGGTDQYAVAAGMEKVCAASGCDFALYDGDNFYSTGVSELNDTQFQEKFELPYQHLDFPFYVVAGNHDYGGGWSDGAEAWKTDLEVEYTTHSTKWKMPDQFYSWQIGNATFIGLDTTALDGGSVTEQAEWLPSELAASHTTWKFAYGHHPYLSNGEHGNAKDSLGAFVETNLCGQVDVYFSGHDHDLEWVQDECDGTQFIVSGGGGASTRGMSGSDADYFAAESHGFLWVELDGNTFTGVFYDQDGNELYRRSFTK